MHKAAAVNRAMLRRAWAMGAAPPPGILTIDPDATWIETSGRKKEGAAFSFKHEVGLSPMVGVVGETGDVVGIRARGGNANAGRAMGSFVDECVGAVPKEVRGRYQLWLRVDSAGYGEEVVEAAERHNMVFTITAKKTTRVQAAIVRLASDPATVWVPAIGAEEDKGSERESLIVHTRRPLTATATSCTESIFIGPHLSTIVDISSMSTCVHNRCLSTDVDTMPGTGCRCRERHTPPEDSSLTAGHTFGAHPAMTLSLLYRRSAASSS